MESIVNVSPLDTVQIFSIFSYVTTLSDFLFTENYLNENDQYKHIPIVNALYRYINNENNLPNERKLHLAKKLLNNTDLYGAKENEIPDSQFVDKLIDHIVNSLVFDQFTNVYGFIAEILSYTTNDSFQYLMQRLKKSLAGLKFENENGESSSLDSQAVENIFNFIIQPLFPRPENTSMRITSIDYIYAQAGKMFQRTGEASPTTTHQENFQEYVETAHTIEQLVVAKKINETILKIFALPAFINYIIYNQRGKLNFENEGLLSHQNWMEAFHSLFTRLNEAFLEIDKVRNEDYRYQFYLALSSIKNRTTLARETIQEHCQPLSDNEIDDEVTRYKNEPDGYKCRNSTNDAKLENLNTKFQQLIENTTHKYHRYELESCREAFGPDFIASINKQKVIITKGLIHYPFDAPFGFEFSAHQLTRPSDDLFEFYLPENETFLYYALIRNNYNVTMIEEKANPILFRQKLGLDVNESLKDKYFPIQMKNDDEDFEVFLSRIATQRSKQFEGNLKAGYDQTRREWWKDFGLSLIPFYSCVQNIKLKNTIEASIFCPLDVLFFIPLAGEVGSLTTSAFKSIVKLSETTLRTVTLRTSLQTTFRITGKVLLLGIKDFAEIFTREKFQKIGATALRFIDPGFELIFRLGTETLGLIQRTLVRLEKIHLANFRNIRSMLERSIKVISNFPRKIGTFSGKNLWVKSTGSENSGFGYKFIPLGEFGSAEIRTIGKEEFPLVKGKKGSLRDEREIYRKVDLETEKIISDEFFIDTEEGIILSEEKSFETIIVDHPNELVQGGNPMTQVMHNGKTKNFLEAVNFALKRGRISKGEIESQLKKYTFRGDKTEMNFVQEFLDHNLKTPQWAKELKISQSEIFFKLKTKLFMEFPELTLKTASEKIEKLYPRAKYPELINELSVEKVFHDFKTKGAYKHVTFEDYYALRNYGATGYRKMGGNCHEARRMKNAIYRLAIRQSEDPGEICVGKLFRGEKRSTETMEREFYPGRETITLQRFTSTTTDLQTANLYSETVNPSYTKVIYRINLNEPYLRARVEDLFVLNEKETILLPGMEFKIDKVTRGVGEKSQNYMNVELSLTRNSIVKTQQRIMEEIEKLMKTDTVFYAQDLAR